MEKLHVLVTVVLDKTQLEKIAAVGPGVEVRYGAEETLLERGIRPGSRQRSQRRRLALKEASAALDGMLADTDVIFGWRLPLNVMARAPRLKWVHGIGAGVDLTVGDSGLLQSDIVITGSRGVRTVFVAEFSLYLMLMLAKKAPELMASQVAHRWQPSIGQVLSGKTLGVVGLGSIGGEVARLARAFNMRVLATRRSATARQKDTGGVAEIFPPGELLQMLPRCDFVVLTVPLTPETRGLIGEAELGAMKPTACIVNVSRGPVVREDILVRALKEGWIAGAALDVFETEPLPPDSELWDMPNVIISPHIAGHREQHPAPLTGLFCENLRRFLAGRALLNVIDKEKGY